MEGLVYKFKVHMRDGSVFENEYTLKVEEVAYIHMYAEGDLLPPCIFFFTKDNCKLRKFFGKAFFSTSGRKNYFYCIYTDTFRIFVNAFKGTVVFADDTQYVIKP